MSQLQKYTWLIETISRAGRISLQELSERWERNYQLNNGDPLPRATFNRWIKNIRDQFGIIINCQRSNGYLYYIENLDDLEDEELRKWMLDSVAIGNLISENLDLKDRILTDSIPSGRDHLTTILSAMKENRRIEITYKSFQSYAPCTFAVEPYCVKLFENRWYLLANNPGLGDLRIYGLDRMAEAVVLEQKFKLPRKFNASQFFANYFGIVTYRDIKPRRIVLSATHDHAPYMKSLPLHHSQRLIGERDGKSLFELYLSPTYDFIMELLHAGAMVEVLEPEDLRREMKAWITDMAKLYED